MITDTEIREAVRECLTDCLTSDLPLSVIAAYIGRLHGKDWQAEDIHTVESIVIKILRRLTDSTVEVVEDQSDCSHSNH